MLLSEENGIIQTRSFFPPEEKGIIQTRSILMSEEKDILQTQSTFMSEEKGIIQTQSILLSKEKDITQTRSNCFVISEYVFVVDRFGRWGEVWGAAMAHVQDRDNVQWRPRLQWVYTTPTSVVAAACTSLVCSVTRRFPERRDTLILGFDFFEPWLLYCVNGRMRFSERLRDTLTLGALTFLNHDCFVVCFTQGGSQRE